MFTILYAFSTINDLNNEIEQVIFASWTSGQSLLKNKWVKDKLMVKKVMDKIKYERHIYWHVVWD